MARCKKCDLVDGVCMTCELRAEYDRGRQDEREAILAEIDRRARTHKLKAARWAFFGLAAHLRCEKKDGE